MARPSKLEVATVDGWLGEHPGWEREREGIARSYTFPDFSAALGFVVRLGLVAEKRDHHPDVMLSWGKARVFWTTHDAGGITQLDLDLAAAGDAIAG